MKIKLPVTWEMCGMVEIEADSIEDAIENFYELTDEIPLPNGDYVDASFNLSCSEAEYIECFNKKG